MASFEKVTNNNVGGLIGHVERTLESYSNESIDPERLGDCYMLSPDRGESSYQYYTELRDACYVYGRADVKTLVGIVVTQPYDTPQDREEDFFRATYDFVAERYGERNIITAAVHKDEAGERPHVHILVCPVVPDERHEEGRKICCSEVFSLREYREFHPAFQKYLSDHDIPGTVRSGITREIGGNRTVREIKEMSPYEQKRLQEMQRELSKKERQVKRER